MIRKPHFFFTALLAVAITLSLFVRFPRSFSNDQARIDLDSIRKRGKLIAVTNFNSTDYFIYKGEPGGFTYELLKTFAKHLGTDLEIITESNAEKAVDMLNKGKADIIAEVLPSGQLKVKLTDPVDQTRKILVRRKHNSLPAMTGEMQQEMRDQFSLETGAVYVQGGYGGQVSLASLSSALGDSVRILDAPYDEDKLIEFVAGGIIDYAVCDENIALVNSTIYPGIDVSRNAGPVELKSWAVRERHSDSLLLELNSWMAEYRKTRDYKFLYAEYFRNSRSGMIIRSDYYAHKTGRISRYDEIIKKYSDRINWDWRLLASLICQESRFNPSVESGKGAYGLMQIMPETGERMGIDIKSSPENNIRAGIKYISFLHRIFEKKVSDPNERINFILAAYNAGPGHVLDAMKLARKNGMDPGIWKDNVEVWMLKKSIPEYYNDEVVKNGFFTGKESVKFVAQILGRYEHYKNAVRDGN
ncbi:MAG TPA: transglycosylase SLT domain-containing protein [Bacteroidales bacterium]|nr:transglycosylase SLT domain-containing protein [Bacteroidales bacterium]